MVNTRWWAVSYCRLLGRVEMVGRLSRWRRARVTGTTSMPPSRRRATTRSRVRLCSLPKPAGRALSTEAGGPCMLPRLSPMAMRTALSQLPRGVTRARARRPRAAPQARTSAQANGRPNSLRRAAGLGGTGAGARPDDQRSQAAPPPRVEAPIHRAQAQSRLTPVCHRSLPPVVVSIGPGETSSGRGAWRAGGRTGIRPVLRERRRCGSGCAGPGVPQATPTYQIAHVRIWK
mmetsp:Transcript_11949/g.27758  ORF Transcript_11949/g.27758 Transcript_11949/m.27758 type:complete len:232 (+) Transcript_11949:458-1153(+)